jgi:RNA polymerase sigma factor (sigma-70 family)
MMPKLPIAPADRLLPALRRAVLVRDFADRTDGQLLTAFLHDRDGDAFAVLVRRHGPMVLGVARRVIGDVHTADDAFQAVFLVLARRANAVRPREQVGNWLYGVAYRTAIKARMVLARRRSRERQVDAMPETVQLPPDSWSDLQPVIDAELALLPNKLRVPVVLCDLEGRPQRSVAKQLGIAPATLAARVAAARRLLAERLGKRGISLSGGALAVVLGERAAAAHVPAPLADAAVRAAEAVIAGNAPAGFVSAHALQLSDGVMRMMMLAKLKAACVAVLVAVLAVGGFGATQAAAEEPNAAPAAGITIEVAGKPAPHPDDVFLRRTLLDLAGAVPTPLEYALFRTDADANKRAKVIDWLIADARVQQSVAKRLGIDTGRVQLSRDGTHGIALKVLPEEAARARLSTVRSTVNVTAEYLNTGGAAWLRTNPPATFLTEIHEAGRRNLNAIWNPYFSTGDVQPSVTNLALVQETNQRAEILYYAVDLHSERNADIAFIAEAVKAARGSAPTPLEERYFTEDKDPKKREKLLDTLLKEPAAAKKLGEAWKKKMLEPKPEVARWTTQLKYSPQVASTYRLFLSVKQPDAIEALVDSLIAAKKTDDQILEAVTLASAKRLPTAEEKKATLAVIGVAADKRSAWIAIAKSVAK